MEGLCGSGGGYEIEIRGSAGCRPVKAEEKLGTGRYASSASAHGR